MAQRAQRCDYCAVIPDFSAVIPDFYPRHSRESGNPEGGGRRCDCPRAICRHAIAFSYQRLAGASVFVRIRIYRIIGFSGFPRRMALTGKRLSVFGLAGFPVMAKSARWAKRNPVNPVNPANPDSDKDAQPPPPCPAGTMKSETALINSLISARASSPRIQTISERNF